MGEPVVAGWMRIVPPGPTPPRVCSVDNGQHLHTGSGMATGCIKLVLEDTPRPDLFRATLDGTTLDGARAYCTDSLRQRHEIYVQLPKSTKPGKHNLDINIGRRALAPVIIELR